MNLSTTLSYGPLTLDIAYDFFPATPDVFYLRNGDPGYPGSDAELSIISITSPQAPGLDFLDIFSIHGLRARPRHALPHRRHLPIRRLRPGRRAAAREEAALDSYYDSLRDR